MLFGLQHYTICYPSMSTVIGDLRNKRLSFSSQRYHFAPTVLSPAYNWPMLFLVWVYITVFYLSRCQWMRKVCRLTYQADRPVQNAHNTFWNTLFFPHACKIRLAFAWSCHLSVMPQLGFFITLNSKWIPGYIQENLSGSEKAILFQLHILLHLILWALVRW